MAKVLPSRKQDKSAIHKVLNSVRNRHDRQLQKVSVNKKASKKTGLIK